MGALGDKSCATGDSALYTAADFFPSPMAALNSNT
jgi:hypothetical protein